MNASTTLYDDGQESGLTNGAAGRHQASSVTIHSTRNYSMFRFAESNRSINPSHLEDLYDSVVSKNMLSKYPIVVTPSLVVIDGQHRLKVAEALGVPIFYIIADDMSVNDIRIINDISKKWLHTDYLHYWCEQGNDHYKKIRALLQRYEWASPAFVFEVCTTITKPSGGRGGWSPGFRQGLSTSSRLPIAEKTLLHALDFKPYFKKYGAVTFLAALRNTIELPGYDPARMKKKLETLSSRLVECVTREEYIAMLGEIYNHGATAAYRVDFSQYKQLRVQRGIETKRLLKRAKG